MNKILDDISMDNKKNAEEKDDIQALESAPNPREEAMARMVENATESREESRQELIDAQGFDPEPLEDELNPNEDLVEPIIEKTDEPIDKALETTDTHIIERDGRQFLKLKVKGVETEMPIEAAIGAIQKNENADQKLWDANQTQKKYDDLIAQHVDTATPPDASEEIAVDTREALKDAFTKVYDGDVDEAAEDLAKILQPIQPSKPVNVQAQVVEAVAKMDNHKNLRSAYDTFMADEDFKNITNDPVLLERVNTFTEALQRDSDFLATNPTYDDYFREAGKKTQEWVDSISGTTKAPPPQNVDTRLERKRTAPTTPQPRTVRRGPKVEEPAYDNRETIIQKMARQRGQTNL